MQALASAIFSLDYVRTILQVATPLLLAALGGLFSERSGVLNLALEGQMLMGAFFGWLGAYYSHSLLAGIVCALAAGSLLALLHAVLCVHLKADQIVSSVALNLLAAGATGYAFRVLFASSPQSPAITAMKPLPVPLLSAIPGLGPVLFTQSPLVYTALLLVPVVAAVMYRTSWGLSIRATGDHPRAADTLGISVLAVRRNAVLLSGALAGLGGAYLTLVLVPYYQDNLTAGRGFIAFAAIVFGKWTPVGTFLACLLFGAADALQLRIQGSGLAIPYQFMLMLPYVVTLLALLGFVGRAVGPATSGVPYSPEER